MELELKRGGRKARITTLGAELVSYRDETGREYIWSGDPAYWPGRNPLLFPIVGGLRDGKIQVKGREVSMERHGFARRREFAVTGQGADWAELTLEQDEATLALYPWPFRLAVRQQLIDGGFSTSVTVTNTGTEPLPYCVGAHTGFRCPLDAGEAFTDYDIIFPQKETCKTMVPDANGLDWGRTLPCLENTDTLPLDYHWFDELDTLIFQGLKSQSVRLVSRKSGRGVEVSFPGYPLLAFWTMPGKKAPYLCIEPWHGCSAVAGEGPELADKAYCITLAPGESRTLGYTVQTF